MKTNWQRHDTDTDFLFNCESQLHRNFINEAPDVLKKLKKRFDELAASGIGTSHGLDHFLQVAMAWLTTNLGLKSGQPSFRATVSLYLQIKKAILVKTCLVYPGKCKAPQPTISLAESAGPPGRIGHAGVGTFLNKIVYCQPASTRCPQHIQLEPDFALPRRKTVGALSIPLGGRFNSLRKSFKKETHSRVCLSRKDRSRFAEKQRQYKAKGNPGPPSLWVLNFECLSQSLTRDFANERLFDPEFSEVIETMIALLASYQKQRDTHRALERSSTILALATNTLRPRSAYRALLREISNTCDGADVTLHLRDLFDGKNSKENQRNRDRCSVFVTGVGINFRDFLINERIGLRSGQIGWALEKTIARKGKVSKSGLFLQVAGEAGPETIRVQYIVGSEIEEALRRAPHALPFKQLMPNTVLNAVVPIYFHDLKIGVINLEWDKQHLERGLSALGLDPLPDTVPEDGRLTIEQYLSQRLPVVYRMADYLSLVIDYFDDVTHLAGTPTSIQLADPQFVRDISREGALRRIMGYYVGRGMHTALELAKGKLDSEKAEKRCLQDLVDAVGYFLASTHILRILVSVRRTRKEQGKRVLKRHVSHWLEGHHQYQEHLRKPIIIADKATVLATTAYRGIPLFGKVVGKGETKSLELDPLCVQLLPNPANPKAGTLDSVPYSPAGPEPRYEIGMPLVFGKRMLGTFDFEQFQLEPTEEKVALNERQLCAHLEWARAISFLIAYLEDAQSSTDKTDAFRNFQSLCAQLIAEVPVKTEQFVAIATDAFAEIVPVKNGQLEQTIPADKAPPERNDIAMGRAIAQLRFRGGGDRLLSWELDDFSNALLQSKTEAEPGRTVTSMMTSFHALFDSLPSENPGDDQFILAVNGILEDLEIKEGELASNSDDAAQTVLKVFSFLHESLVRYLPVSGGRARPHKPSDYAWFLHVSRLASATGREEWVCNPDPREPALRLVYCYTREMDEISTEVQKRTGKDLVSSLFSVLKERAQTSQSKTIDREAFERVVAEITKTITNDASHRDLIEAITATLVQPRDDPDDRTGRPARGFTRSVIRAGHPIVVPEINVSPNRSERNHGWFFKYPYTVIGIPFTLAGQCIAVLNVFRRRDSSRDMKFFRIEERDAAQALANRVDGLFNKILAVEAFGEVSSEELRSGFSSLADAITARILREDPKVIVIRSPFARSRESFEVLFRYVFGKDAPGKFKPPVRYPDEERSYSGRSVVMRVPRYHDDKELKLHQLGQILGSMTRAGRASHVFVFVSNKEDVELEAVPVYASHVSSHSLDESLLKRDVTPEEDLYFKWLLGTVIVGGPGPKSLVARSNSWNHSAFRDWLRKEERSAERADFYSASRHLAETSSWRPDAEIVLLNRWDV